MSVNITEFVQNKFNHFLFVISFTLAVIIIYKSKLVLNPEHIHSSILKFLLLILFSYSN